MARMVGSPDYTQTQRAASLCDGDCLKVERRVLLVFSSKFGEIMYVETETINQGYSPYIF